MDIDDDTVGGVAIESTQLLASVLTDYPLPWSVTWDDFEMDITAANENRLIYGNVNRGVEYGDQAAIPEIIKRALSDFIKANRDVRRIAYERDALRDALLVRIEQARVSGSDNPCGLCGRYIGHHETCRHYATEREVTQ